uniref:Uncharacterized protein n=1 Tax=Anguilla anguilla TaxID=7936 RepID=A0A0E9RHP3_ANGAN
MMALSLSFFRQMVTSYCTRQSEFSLWPPLAGWLSHLFEHPAAVLALSLPSSPDGVLTSPSQTGRLIHWLPSANV